MDFGESIIVSFGPFWVHFGAFLSMYYREFWIILGAFWSILRGFDVFQRAFELCLVVILVDFSGFRWLLVDFGVWI